MFMNFKIVIEKHADGYIAYPLGYQEIITGRGETYEEALEEVKAAIIYRVTTFGKEVLELDSPVLEAFMEDAAITIGEI
jgi:predicted RNase H-like HicB family nuclease